MPNDPDSDYGVWSAWDDLEAAHAKIKQLEAENADLKTQLDRVTKLLEQYINKAGHDKLTEILNAN